MRAMAWLASGLAVLLLFFSFFRVVPAGSAGVPVTFGATGSQVGPGLHLVLPVTGMSNISVRTQAYTMAAKGDDPSVQVLGRDGTVATADATLLYRVQREKATDVYENLGPGYQRAVVRPTARTCTRGAFAKYDMVDAATTQFQQVESDIDGCIKAKLNPFGVQVQDFQLRELRLAPQLQNAIDAKIAAATAGASGPLSDEYLRFLYIQTLQQFAKNGNATIVQGDGNIGFNFPAAGPSTTTTTAPGK
jgi:regulator of protease activity HflC (stomatin/prohibitin superfamily)